EVRVQHLPVAEHQRVPEHLKPSHMLPAAFALGHRTSWTCYLELNKRLLRTCPQKGMSSSVIWESTFPSPACEEAAAAALRSCRASSPLPLSITMLSATTSVV